jgi:uncharacterized protein (DUF2236 family)
VATLAPAAARVVHVPSPPALPRGRSGDPGLFGPGSQVWRIARERLLLLGGPAALLLQLAHPLVAAGVDRHSTFRGAPMRRLNATLSVTLTVSFGDTEQATGAVARVGRLHRRVRGATRESVGRYPAGTAYSATDPELLLWVHTTLVWSALATYDAFVGPLTPEDRARYVEEMSAQARLFGVPRAALPGDYAAFHRSFEDTVEGSALVVDATARALAADVLGGAFPAPPPLDRVRDVVLAGLLPDRLRRDYGLPWGRADRLLFDSVRRSVRAAAPRLPAAVRFWPHYRTALARVAAGPDGPRPPG